MNWQVIMFGFLLIVLIVLIKIPTQARQNVFDPSSGCEIVRVYPSRYSASMQLEMNEYVILAIKGIQAVLLHPETTYANFIVYVKHEIDHINRLNQSKVIESNLNESDFDIAATMTTRDRRKLYQCLDQTLARLKF